MPRRELRVLCTLLLTASTACSALGGPQAQSSGPIKIGMVTSLTGNYAPLGTNDKLAAQQVVDGVNNKGGINGRKIDLEIVDDGSDPNQSVIQYNKVLSDGAVAVLGPPQSTADLAIVLVDARLGVLPQSRRHACIATLLGISHLVVAVNKMDLVDYHEEVFSAIRQEFTPFLRELGASDVQFIPISALHG